MRILVIDDNQTHLDAAVAQLGDEHEVVVASSYDKGRDQLAPEVDYTKVRELCDGGMSMAEAKKAAATPEISFDVVLCDLLMPASRHQQGPDGARFVGQEMPIGIFLAILAAKNGVGHVGLLTDSDHHSHPASACLDAISGHATSPKRFSIESATVCLANNPNWVDKFDPSDLSKPLDFDDWYQKNRETVNAKCWDKLLNWLLTGERPKRSLA